jgi:hypothetical protein
VVAGGEDGFGLGVAVGLPGEHGEVVGGEAEVVEAFAGEVVVDGAVGGFGGGPQGPLDFGEDGVGFGEGAEVFGSVVAGEFVVCGLVEADADVSVGLAGGVFDFVFGEEAVGAGGLVAAPVDASPQEGLEVLVAVDVVAADVGRSSDEVDLYFGWFALGGVVGFEAVVAVGGLPRLRWRPTRPMWPALRSRSRWTPRRARS